MVHGIKVGGKIHAHHICIALIHKLEAGFECIMRSSFRAESVTVFRELHLIQWCQFLCNCLLYHTVDHRWDTQFPYFPFLLFGYFYPADWVGFVFSFPQLLNEFRLVFSQVGQKFIHLHSIDSTFAFVPFHLKICLIQVIFSDDEFQQVVRPKVCDGAVVTRNPPIVEHSCFPSLFRRYYTQVVFHMKLSVLKSIFG